ncbi:MAG: hypothetical protein LBI60_03330 [Bacteroidales bacterium]|jgi:hypothetical protein|nr:hypothetical protein [Bacteroidales bacterium]
MKIRKLQIDVMKESYRNYVRVETLVRCKLYIDGDATIVWMSKASYGTLIRNGFFIRDGKEADSSGAVNTTAVYLEKNQQ